MSVKHGVFSSKMPVYPCTESNAQQNGVFQHAARAVLLLLIVLSATPIQGWAAEVCGRSGVALQVLGSGGPIADDNRSSSGYLLWIDGKARVLVDAGSGTFTRFGQAGAQFADLHLVALSHFHTDHASGLPALLKTGYFSPRTRPLPIAGPSGAGRFPSLDDFLVRLLDRNQGAFAYLAGYLDGSDGLVKLQPSTIATDSPTPTRVFDNKILTVDGLGVPHGIVPSVAYAISVAGKTVVLGSDQNGASPAFQQMAMNADLLLLHAVIPEQAGRAARSLHAVPSRLGAIAKAAKPHHLVLSHWMARSLRVQEDIVGTVKSVFDGKLSLATDMACFPLSQESEVQ